MKKSFLTIISTIIVILLLQLTALLLYGKTLSDSYVSWSPDGKYIFVGHREYSFEGILKLSKSKKYLYFTEIELKTKNGIRIIKTNCTNLDQIKLDIRWDMDNNKVYYTKDNYINITTGEYTCP